MSGGQASRERALTVIMCGGNEAPYKQASPSSWPSPGLSPHGASGAGQLTKDGQPDRIAGLGGFRKVHFARAGLDGEAVVADDFQGGAAQSWRMENRFKTMLSTAVRLGFAVDWML